MKKLVVGVILSSSLTAVNLYAADIPMVGLNEDGSPIETFVPEMPYKEKLTQGIISVQESTIPILQKRGESKKGWMLRSVIVGLGIQMEIKLGPIVKFGVLPRFRIGFSNSRDPSIT